MASEADGHGTAHATGPAVARAQPTSPVGLIAGSGTLPFAVAESLVRRGLTPIFFALKGICDAARVKPYRHHWISIGQFGHFKRLARAENCRDLIFVGALVRPAFSEIRLDWGTLRVIPSVIAAYRGGDDHLLTGVGRIFEQHGFRIFGVGEVAPDLLMPDGVLTRAKPDAAAESDIALGREALRALSPFDVGQAVVVIDGHVVAVEDIEGTDGLLTRIARLRTERRIRNKPGRGTLVKMPKLGQDLRLDLPTLGPRTMDGAIAAGLGGVAIAAGRTIVVEPQRMIEAADRAGLFLAGLPT